MNLYFQNYKKERRLIGCPSDLNSANRMIKRFCSERDFKIRYVRVYVSNSETIFDVGNRQEFFVLDCEIDIQE